MLMHFFLGIKSGSECFGRIRIRILEKVGSGFGSSLLGPEPKIFIEARFLLEPKDFFIDFKK